MADEASLVTPEMKDQKGRWGPARMSYPISESDIRKWAIATYWPTTPPRIFWDAQYAETTRWNGVIAPEDFNPFAWPVPEVANTQWVLPAPRSGTRLNGGQTDTYGSRMRPGDVIKSRARLSHWNARGGRTGIMLFCFYETEWSNQHDDLVKRRIATVIQIQPGG